MIIKAIINILITLYFTLLFIVEISMLGNVEKTTLMGLFIVSKIITFTCLMFYFANKADNAMQHIGDDSDDGDDKSKEV